MHRGTPARRGHMNQHGLYGASANSNDRYEGPSRPPYRSNFYYTRQQTNDVDGFDGHRGPPRQQYAARFRQRSNDTFSHSFGSPRPLYTPAPAGFTSQYRGGGSHSPETPYSNQQFQRRMTNFGNPKVPMDPTPVMSLVIRLNDAQ